MAAHSRVSPKKNNGMNAPELKIEAAVRDNPLAPLVFVGLQILASLFFVPRTVPLMTGFLIVVAGFAATLVEGLAGKEASMPV